jgi:thiol-disulfide isomerase/thioredoxin
MKRLFALSTFALLALAGCPSSTPVVAPSPTTSAPTADDLLAQAESKSFAGDQKSAADLYAKAIELDPSNRAVLDMAAEGLSTSGEKMHESGDTEGAAAAWVKAGGAARKVQEGFGGELTDGERLLVGRCLYNEGRARAIQGDAAGAVAAFDKALEAGLKVTDEMFAEGDFAAVKDDAAMQEFLEKMSHRGEFLFDFELPDLDGKTVRLADFKGSVVIVDFWGTWCPPCRQEIPHFVQLRNEYSTADLQIVGINYERVPNDQVQATIRQGIADLSINYPCVIGDDATQTRVPEFNAFPTTLFIDRTGKVRKKMVGFSPAHVQEIRDLVAKLVAEPNPAAAAGQ